MSGAAHRASGGIVVTAILEFLGSAFTLLFAAILFAVSNIRKLPAEVPGHALPFSLKGVLIGEAVFLLALGTLGMATGIGLLRLRGWARISTLVFAGIVAFFGLATLLPVFTLPTLVPPNMPREGMRGVQIFMAAYSLLQIGIGAWWIILFNRAGVKAQFTAARIPVSADALPAGTGATSPTRRRPLSITIMGWYLIVSSCLVIFPLLLRMPGFLLVWTWTGWRAGAYYSVLALIHVALGVGLLKLSEPARRVAVAYYVFSIVAALTTPFLPGYQERLEAAIRAMPFYHPDMRLPHMAWAAWLGMVCGVLVCGVILFFLIRERKAFEPPRPAAAAG